VPIQLPKVDLQADRGPWTGFTLLTSLFTFPAGCSISSSTCSVKYYNDDTQSVAPYGVSWTSGSQSFVVSTNTGTTTLLNNPQFFKLSCKDNSGVQVDSLAFEVEVRQLCDEKIYPNV
jgi:hypothetical protein